MQLTGKQTLKIIFYISAVITNIAEIIILILSSCMIDTAREHESTINTLPADNTAILFHIKPLAL